VEIGERIRTTAAGIQPEGLKRLQQIENCDPAYRRLSRHGHLSRLDYRLSRRSKAGSHERAIALCMLLGHFGERNGILRTLSSYRLKDGVYGAQV
jgi:hypothetical protein